MSQAVEADLLKARKDGKALIVEGAPVLGPRATAGSHFGRALLASEVAAIAR